MNIRKKERNILSEVDMNEFLHCLTSFSKVYKSYLKKYEKIAENHGLSKSDVEVLAYLSLNNHGDTSREICEFWGVSKALISRSVEELFHKNMVAFVPDTQDRRTMRIVLDKESEAVVDEIKETRKQFRDKLSAGISREDFETFMRVLKTMYNNVVE